MVLVTRAFQMMLTQMSWSLSCRITQCSLLDFSLPRATPTHGCGVIAMLRQGQRRELDVGDTMFYGSHGGQWLPLLWIKQTNSTVTRASGAGWESDWEHGFWFLTSCTEASILLYPPLLPFPQLQHGDNFLRVLVKIACVHACKIAHRTVLDVVNFA